MMKAPRPLARSSAAFWRGVAFVFALVFAGSLGTARPASAAANSITQPDIGGQYTSLKLDGSGLPVISHFDAATQKVKVVRCGDSNCSAGNTIAAPDAMAAAVTGIGHTSIALAGNTPVVTHYDSDPRDLRFVHCGGASCVSPTLRSLDSGITDNVGIYASLAINGSGNPVVAYYSEPFDYLKVLVCGDATCSTYGDQVVDSAAITGLYPSLALDASGFPVISYYDQSATDLNVARCSDAICSASVIQVVDGAAPATQVGKYSSLALDAAGFPVISYYNETNGDLKVVHCGDATCTTGNTIATPDSAGTVGQYTSIALDTSGNPVVSYYNASGSSLKVLHCGNTTCTAGNTMVTPDMDGTVGQYPSIALDGSGNPVVSYYDASDAKLNLLHCADAFCVGSADPVGGATELAAITQSATNEPRTRTWLLPTCAVVGLVLVAGVLRRSRRRLPGA